MKNIKIRNKLSIILIIALVMIISAGFCAISGMTQIKEQANKTLEEETRAQYDENIKEEVENAISMLAQYYAKYEAGECTLEEAKKQGADMLRELRYGENGYFWADDTEGNNVVLLGSDTEGTNRLATKDANGYQMVKDIIAVGQQPDGGYCDYVFPKEGGTEPFPKRSYSKLYEPFGWVIGTGNYIDYIDEVLLEEEAAINKTVQKWTTFLFVCVLVFLALMILITISVIIDITSSMKNVVAFLGNLEKGDMTVRGREKQMERKDEFGTLERTLNHLAVTLDEVLGNVKNASVRLADGVVDVIGSMDHLNDDIEGVSAATEELSASMEETAASAQQIDIMSQEIETVSKNIAVRSQDGAEKAVSIHDRAMKAKKDTEENQRKVSEIKKEISVRLEKALEDAKVVEQIEVLAESIMNITSQTNLLALNASIEAARAGEAGRGFAVVADEIRNLAEQSKNTVENIQKMTQDVTGAVENLSNDSSRLLDFVAEDITDSFHSFIEVADAYNEDAAYVDELVTDFSAISEELLASIDGVTQSINDVSKAANEGALGTGEIAERCANVAEKSSEILGVVNTAGGTSEQLKASVEKFIISA